MIKLVIMAVSAAILASCSAGEGSPALEATTIEASPYELLARQAMFEEYLAKPERSR